MNVVPLSSESAVEQLAVNLPNTPPKAPQRQPGKADVKAPDKKPSRIKKP